MTVRGYCTFVCTEDYILDCCQSLFVYDSILAMLLELSKNGRLEATQFSVATSCETVSVIQRDALRNTFTLTAPGSLNTLSNVQKAGGAHNVIVVHEASKFRSRSKSPRNWRLKACWRFFASLTQPRLDLLTARLTVQALPAVQLWHCMH